MNPPSPDQPQPSSWPPAPALPPVLPPGLVTFGEREVRRRPVLAGVLAVAGAAVIAGLGAPLGWLWALIAPDVPVEMTADGPVLAEPQPEEYFAGDGWFLALGAAFGLLVAVLAWYLLRRIRGPVGIVMLVVGGVGAALLAWYVGRHIGLAEYHRLVTSAPVGSRFGKPPDLRIKQLRLWHGFLPVIRGLLLLPAFTAAVTYTLMAGWSRYATLRAETEPPPVSWDSAGLPAPTAAPGPPGSGAAGPPRD